MPIKFPALHCTKFLAKLLLKKQFIRKNPSR
jgi:hypothetical protein